MEINILFFCVLEYHCFYLLVLIYINFPTSFDSFCGCKRCVRITYFSQCGKAFLNSFQNLTMNSCVLTSLILWYKIKVWKYTFKDF